MVELVLTDDALARARDELRRLGATVGGVPADAAERFGAVAEARLRIAQALCGQIEALAVALGAVREEAPAGRPASEAWAEVYVVAIALGLDAWGAGVGEFRDPLVEAALSADRVADIPAAVLRAAALRCLRAVASAAGVAFLAPEAEPAIGREWRRIREVLGATRG